MASPAGESQSFPPMAASPSMSTMSMAAPNIGDSLPGMMGYENTMEINETEAIGMNDMNPMITSPAGQ